MREPAMLIRQLIRSTSVYAKSRINNKKDQESYIKGIARCSYICSEAAGGSDMPHMLAELRKLQRDVPRTFKQRLELFADTKKYYMMAIDQCVDIVESINIRFNLGYSSSDDIFVETILERNHEV